MAAVAFPPAARSVVQDQANHRASGVHAAGPAGPHCSPPLPVSWQEGPRGEGWSGGAGHGSESCLDSGELNG